MTRSPTSAHRQSPVLWAALLLLLAFAVASAQECPENQAFNNCGTACPPRCNEPPRPCTLQCVIGCQCKSGFVLNSSGVCVRPQDC